MRVTCDICGKEFDADKSGVVCGNCHKVVCADCQSMHMVPASQDEDDICTVCAGDLVLSTT